MMFKKLPVILLLLSTLSNAAVRELVPSLQSDDLEVQTRARLELLAICSEAGAPDAPEGARKAVCVEICSLLEDPEQPVVSVVQPMLNNLARIGGKESVPTLTRLLDHKDEHIRDDARRALALNPSVEAGQALSTKLMKDGSRSPRMTAGLITALGERREAGASERIAGYLSSTDGNVYLAAVKALGRLNEDAGIRALQSERPRAQGFHRTQLDAALLSTGRHAVLEALYAKDEPDEVRAAALLGLLLEGDTGMAADAVQSGNTALQRAVIEGAAQGRDAKLYDLIARELDQLDPCMQLKALAALEFSENSDYANAVEPLLESDDLLVQDGASAALARIGTSSTVTALLANGRPAARRALGLLNVDGVDRVLEEEAGRSEDRSRRSVAIEALAIRGRRDLIPVFVKYVAEDDGEPSMAAARAIGRLGNLSEVDQLASLMVDMETSSVARGLLEAMVDIMRRTTEPGKAVNILMSHMDGASPRSQANILQALVRTEREEALMPLAEACRSEDAQLQKTAVKLMSGWQNKNALPDMIELASDESMSLANHVTLMRGISRLLAAQRRPDPDLAEQALAACRRDEERQMIRAVVDAKQR